MRAPAFWSAKPGLIAWLLTPLAWIYGRVTFWRMSWRGGRAVLPVICVGNLTVGGAGKTPTVLMLANALAQAGEKPFVVSRGYGGKIPGTSRVDPVAMTAAECGDEPLLLARHVPTIVSRDRLAGAAMAHAQGATVVLLDDGYQNPSLLKDFALVVVDGEAGFGNGLCMPAGPLRAPVDLQLRHADAVLIIANTAGEAGPGLGALAASGKAVFRAVLQPDPATISRLMAKPVLAFAGIGRPEKFFETLRSAGVDVAAVRSFADHHPFSPAEIASLRDEAAHNAWILATTEKDAVRLPADAADIVSLPITLDLSGQGLVERIVSTIAHRRLTP